MACHQFGAKSAFEPMITYCQLGPYEKTDICGPLLPVQLDLQVIEK